MSDTKYGLDEFRMSLIEDIESIQIYIDAMLDKGDTEETSQKVCMQKALNNLERCMNGVTQKDLSD